MLVLNAFSCTRRKRPMTGSQGAIFSFGESPNPCAAFFLIPIRAKQDPHLVEGAGGRHLSLSFHDLGVHGCGNSPLTQRLSSLHTDRRFTNFFSEAGSYCSSSISTYRDPRIFHASFKPPKATGLAQTAAFSHTTFQGRSHKDWPPPMTCIVSPLPRYPVLWEALQGRSLR